MQKSETKTTNPLLTPDIGDWICHLRDALHLYKSGDLTRREMVARLTTLADKMVAADTPERIAARRESACQNQ